MEEFFSKVSDQLKDFFNSLSLVHKIALIGTTLLIIITISFIFSWLTAAQYKVLYTNLNQEDSSTIARVLKEKNIDFQIADDGKTIRIPADQVEVWRLELAKQGVQLTGTVGYEVFDKQSFGTTSFVQRINRQRALEGELIKTIKHLRGIKRVRVHLSIPESSPFVSEKKPASASIVVELDRGVKLTQEEVRGISFLVSSSVEGLRPEKVVIIDSRGKRLSDNIGDKMTADTANRITLESKISRQYESKIEEILGKVVGEGKVIAKVSVNLDFTETVATETSYDGENSAVLSEVVNRQALQGSRPSPQGFPGARSNLPGEQPKPAIPETRNNVDKNLTTRNFNVPKKIVNSRSPTAKVKNISAAVILDGKRVPIVGEDGKVIIGSEGIPKTKYEAWTDADIDNFTAIVASTLGIASSRGDKLTIRNMEFVEEDLSAAEALIRKREKRELIKNIVKYFAIGLAISLFFFMVVRPFIQWVTENTIESIEDFLPKTLEELERIQTNQKLPGLEDALPQIEEKLNPQKIEGNMLREKIISLIDNDPAKAAQVLTDMIHANEGNKEIA